MCAPRSVQRCAEHAAPPSLAAPILALFLTLAAAGLLTLALVRRRRPRRGTSSRAEEVAMQLQEDFDAEMTDERAFGEMSERVEKETS